MDVSCPRDSSEATYDPVPTMGQGVGVDAYLLPLLGSRIKPHSLRTHRKWCDGILRDPNAQYIGLVLTKSGHRAPTCSMPTGLSPPVTSVAR